MNLRRLAAQTLTAVIHNGQSLTSALDHHVAGLANPKDKALVQAIVYGVIRHYFELNDQLAQLVSKPLKSKEGDIECLILAGIYQLQYMRIKPHAAVAETVAATKHKPWAKALVNAVLRQYQRDSESMASLSEKTTQQHLNHPEWIRKRIQQQWPEQASHLLAANNLAAPMTLRVNRLQASREAYSQQLLSLGFTHQECQFSPFGISLNQAVNVDELPGFRDGWVSVQDEAAQLAADLLDCQPSDRVLDLCAAPGGKTAAILESQTQLQLLLAVDIDDKRLQRVQENLHRLHLKAETLAADATQIQAWGSSLKFERILLDAPCSALGVIRRHPDIKLLRRADDIQALQTLQSQILDAAWSMLAIGGVLLYATCSILKEENEQQIASFLARHPDAEEVTIEADWGEQRPHGRQILTGQQQMDGFYYAKLRKAG